MDVSTLASSALSITEALTNSSIDSEYEDTFVDACGEDPSLLDQPYVRYPFWILYIAVFLVCLIGNLFTMLVITVHPQMRTPTNFFLANLAGADLLVATFCILQNMVHILGFENGRWHLGAILCKLYVFVLHMVPCTSVGILVCVSLEKYVAVLHPLIALKVLTRRLRTIMAISIWSVSIVVNLPYFYTTQLFQWGEMAACGREDVQHLVTASFVIWYVIPVSTLAFIYTKIGLVLWRSGPGIGTASNNQSQSSNGHGGSWHLSNGRVIVYKQESLLQVPDERLLQKKRREVMESRRKAIRLLFFIVLSFAVLTLPHHARLLHSMWSSSPSCNNHWSALLQPLSYILLFVSSAINPILYAFLSKRFRIAAHDVIRCRRSVLLRAPRSRNRTVMSDYDESRRSSCDIRAEIERRMSEAAENTNLLRVSLAHTRASRPKSAPGSRVPSPRPSRKSSPVRPVVIEMTKINRLVTPAILVEEVVD